MSFYLEAYCLDPEKEKPDHQVLIVGPFDWTHITWSFIRAGLDGEDGDEQFVMDDTNGFWYPVAFVELDATGRTSSMRPDLERGRYSDITMLTELGPLADVAPSASRRIAYKDDAAQVKFKLASIAERAWLARYDPEVP